MKQARETLTGNQSAGLTCYARPQHPAFVMSKYLSSEALYKDKAAYYQRLAEKYENALAEIASHGDDNDGCCPYGCDTPTIAIRALQHSGV